MNTIGDISKDFLNSLEIDIEIIGLFERPDELEGTVLQYFVPLLDDYEKNSNGKVSVRYVDPVTYPSILDELNPNEIKRFQSGTNDDLFYVVKSKNNTRVIELYDCFVFDQYMLYYYNIYQAIANNVEMIFTGTMKYLTNDHVKKICFLSGHQETTHEMLNVAIENAGYVVQDISLVGLEQVPDDCAVLIINLPLQDISLAESEMIINYLSSGGNVIVANDYYSLSVEFTHLDTVLRKMNLAMSDSYICENDPGYLFSTENQFVSRALPVGDFKSLADISYCVIAYSRYITESDNEEIYISTLPMISTSENATLVIDGEIDAAGITTGEYIAAMYSISTESGQTAKMAVFGTRCFTADDYIFSVGINDVNVKFIRNLIQELIGDEITVSVESKEFPNYVLQNSLSVSEQTIGTVVLVVVIPLFFFAMALIVYIKRKNK
jgi:ABC-2 type transport system permease protein